VVAFDSDGLLYGLRALVQVINSLSALVDREEDPSVPEGALALRVPPLALSDWPDLPQRGALLSLEREAVEGGVPERVGFFAALHINRLLVALPTDPDSPLDATPPPPSPLLIKEEMKNTFGLIEKHCFLQRITLIPTIVIDSLKTQRFKLI
jgi:hypothetical protein